MSKNSLEKKINCSMSRIARLDKCLVALKRYEEQIETELHLVREELKEYKEQVSNV